MLEPVVPGGALARRLAAHELGIHASGTRELRALGDALLLIDPTDPEPFWNRIAAPDWPPDAAAFWVDFFARMAQTPSWKKYLEDNLFEDGFLRDAGLAKFMGEFPEQIRGILRDAGVKVVR